MNSGSQIVKLVYLKNAFRRADSSHILYRRIEDAESILLETDT